MEKNGITFVIRTLRGGGAERVMSMLANYFVNAGRAVTVITSIAKRETDKDVYKLDARITRVKIPYWNYEIKWWKNDCFPHPLRVRRLKKEIVKSGNLIVVPFMEKSIVPVLMSLPKYRYRIIGALRANPRELNPGFIKRKLWGRYYKRADTMVGLSKEWMDYFTERTVIPVKYLVIPNFHYKVDVTLKPSKEVVLPENFICATGRLHPQKGFDLLIPVFSRINRDYPDLHLVIFGEGEDRDSLEYLVRTLGLGDRVHLVGFVPNPHYYIKKAKMFVLSSRHEGMPVALIEMLSIGMPVVSFNCPTGPSDLIRNEVNGLLIEPENPDRLEKGIRKLLVDEDLAARLGNEAANMSLTLSQDGAFARWEDLLNFGQKF